MIYQILYEIRWDNGKCKIYKNNKNLRKFIEKIVKTKNIYK